MQQYFSILKSKYAQESFTKFAHELLNDVEIGNIKLPVNSAFGNHIESFYYLGSFTDPQGKSLHVLDVNLKTNTKIEQARTMQRNLIARYLKDHWLDGALVAFHNDDATSWRLSFVKVEYKYDEKGNPTEELTPARRYSFLVGEGEPSHTAQTQLAKIYELTSQNPTLAQLEEAFGVEKVTKEFFEKYRELFESVVAELKSNHTFQNEASKNNIDTESFAKKLLGQIVFLYFLQKKGWLGVPKGKSWGEGDKNFLRNIYNEAISETKNFFNNYLEILFYDTLNNSRNDKVDRNYSDFFQSKVPFLNGGLFEPQYDWKNSLIYLDNKLFDKILGVFDTYNFTVKEDEPLEKEVAVDPEMLGKVFENLLEENLRKGKGTYYTPREIVHYMCEESLVNYLAAETNLNADDVKSKYFPAYNVLGDEKIEARDVNVSEKIIDCLKGIKIVDPACGSGAFLVGMLQQITQLRNDLESRSKLLGRREVASTEYEIKKQTIQNCIYGVDIDPGAIEIAKLRLWLSLVVDYDLEQIEPLPNLDYKLMQGNSLLEELVLGDTSVKLYDSESIKKVAGSKRMKNLFDKENQISLFDGDNEKVMKSLKSLQLKYFSTSDSESKKEIRNRIEKIEHELIETSVKSSLENLKSQKGNIRIMPGIGILPEDVKRLEKISSKESQIFAVLDELNKTGTKPFFLWHLYFADVFEEKGGFDIVIANPPYLKEYVSKKAFDGVRNSPYYKGKMDLWYIFACQGVDLLRDKSGILCLIAQNNWVTSYGASKMREKIVSDTQILRLIDFGDYKIFDAGIQTMVMIFRKETDIDGYKFDLRRLKGDAIHYQNVISILNKEKSNNAEYLEPIMERSEFRDKKLTFSDSQTESVLQKIYLKTNFHLNPANEIAQGIVCPQDAVNKASKKKLGESVKIGDGIFILSEEELTALNLSDVELSIIKPLYTTDELRKWGGNAKNKRWIIYTDSSFRTDAINNFPHIKAHLNKFKDVITSDNGPYGLHRARNEYFFKGEKIISVRKCSTPTFSYANFDAYVTATFYVIKTDRIQLKYLLGLLNSKLFAFWLRHKEKMQGNNFQIDKEPLENLPIFDTSNETLKNTIVELVSKTINLTKSEGYLGNIDMQIEAAKYIQKIDSFVYELYEVSDREKEIIEKKND